MSDIIKKSLNQPDETKIPEMVKVEIVAINGTKVKRVTAEPGWRWSKHLKPIVGGESCQENHFVYVVSGKLGSKMEGGKEEEFVPGDVAVIPPGHDGWNAGEEQLVWIELPQ